MKGNRKGTSGMERKSLCIFCEEEWAEIGGVERVDRVGEGRGGVRKKGEGRDREGRREGEAKGNIGKVGRRVEGKALWAGIVGTGMANGIGNNSGVRQLEQE
jgi:hypothetical protein